MKRFNLELIGLFYQKENCFAITLLRIGIGANERGFFKLYITEAYTEVNLCFIKKIFFK